jgi:plasmid stabilization system protein ParE
MEDIVEELRTPSEFPAAGSEEPQSETPQGRTGFVRIGLERAVQATDTMIEGIDNAGTPDTPEGAEAARLISDWSDSALDDLEEAQDSLDEEADSLEESITQLADAARAIGAALTSGVQTLAEVGRTDPELAAAVQQSSTCQQLREETS